MKNFLKFAGNISLIISFFVNSANATESSLCAKKETIFFSCDLGTKTVSLCASTKEDPSPYMEYRFGTPKKIELRHKGEADPNFGFSSAEVTYASNTETIIWFKNQDVSYLLHFPMRGGPLLEVMKKGNTIAEMSCKQGWTHTIGEPSAPSSFIQKKPNGNYVEMLKNWE